MQLLQSLNALVIKYYYGFLFHELLTIHFLIFITNFHQTTRELCSKEKSINMIGVLLQFLVLWNKDILKSFEDIIL